MTPRVNLLEVPRRSDVFFVESIEVNPVSPDDSHTIGVGVFLRFPRKDELPVFRGQAVIILEPRIELWRPRSSRPGSPSLGLLQLTLGPSTPAIGNLVRHPLPSQDTPLSRLNSESEELTITVAVVFDLIEILAEDFGRRSDAIHVFLVLVARKVLLLEARIRVILIRVVVRLDFFALFRGRIAASPVGFKHNPHPLLLSLFLLDRSGCIGFSLSSCGCTDSSLNILLPRCIRRGGGDHVCTLSRCFRLGRRLQRGFPSTFFLFIMLLALFHVLV
jgi:hypothetical protein